MPKFTKKEDELTTMLDKWLYVVKNICYLSEQPKELREQVITKFFEEARIAMFTPEERFAYEVSRKHYWDNLNTISYAISYSFAKGESAGFEKGERSGFEKGESAGVAKEKRNNARKMLSMGMEKETVLQVTGLTEEELSTLEREF